VRRRTTGRLGAESLAAATGLEVTDWVVLDQSAGTTRRTRVEVRLIDGRQRVLFIKTPPRSLIARSVVSLAGLGRAEIGFYRDAAPTVPLVVPRCLSAPISGRPFPLVLDDLVTGGAAVSQLGDELSVGDAEQALAAVAHVHGAFWDDERLAAAEWSWCRSFVPAVEASVGWLLAPALSALGRRRAERCLPDDVGSGLARFARRRTPTLRRLDRGPRTLLHHDCHPGNLARFPDGRVVLFDWQLVRAGPWASDVAYLVATSLSTDDRRTHERRLVDYYLDALLASGGRPPAQAEAWRAYVANLVYPLEAMVVTLALGAMQPAFAVERVVGRAVAAVTDHDALAAAEAFP
jgi:Phosphotransferase enzyme family